jgi:hypothetical protein
MAGFCRLWDSPTKVVTLLKEADLAGLTGLVKTPPRILGRQGKNVLITNR